MLGDHAAMPGSSAGTATGHDRFGQCNGRLVGGKVCLWMLTSVAPGVKIDDRGEGGRERGRGGGRREGEGERRENTVRGCMQQCRLICGSLKPYFWQFSFN